MPPTTAPGRGMGSAGGVNATGHGARPATTARNGNIAGGLNRTRPAPLRRATPSTAPSQHSRAGASAGGPSLASKQPQTVPYSPFASMPGPSFPPNSAFDGIVIEKALVHDRLLQLAHRYLHVSPLSDETTSCDLQSANLYAQLALQIDPASVQARRLLATTLLQGAQSFPFGPSSIHSSPLSLTPHSITPSSSASISGAHAAIEVLKDGTEEVFLDVGCARLFARACSVLGRLHEGREAMAWTLKHTKETNQGIQGSQGSQTSQSAALEMQPPKLPPSNAEETNVQNDLAGLAAKGNDYEQAKAEFLKAKGLDAWSWTAWLGLCEVGCNEDVSSMFEAQVHQPSAFYSTELRSRLLNHGFGEDIVRRTLDDLQQKGEEYYTVGETSQHTVARSEDLATQPLQPMGVQRPAASASANPVKSAASIPRPGTKIEAGKAAAAGTKRVRTTAGSSQAGAAPRAVTGLGQNGRANVAGGTGPADSYTNKRPAGMGLKSRGPQATSTTNIRANGTLAAARTNEQQRPISSASGSSRGASDKDVIKPRRSARVNVADEHPQPPNSQRSAVVSRGGPETGMMGQPRRTVYRSAGVPASSPSEAESMGTGRGTTTTPASKALVGIVQTASFEAARLAAIWSAVDRQVMELVQTLAKAYYAVKNMQSRTALILLRRRGELNDGERAEIRRELGSTTALDSFTGLDDCHRNSVDVQCMIARAYHNLSRYHEAEKHFLHARRLCPSLTTHMDIFSLTLFHLQREVPLSRLARELSQLDAHSCISHIAKGNAFALQREHSLALQSFQRACLAAPTCAYAFTLAGYEAFELGLKDKSVKYFRQAISIERRHWNAFAGLGQVYFESSRHISAAYYYSRAIELHKTSPVLWDVLGGVLCADGKLVEAEAAFERAIELDPAMAISYIKLAEVLLLQGDGEPRKRARAHELLLEAVRHAPEEAHVHLMLAHTYMAKGGGSFARIDQGGKGARSGTGMPLPSELQQLGGAGPSGGSSNAARAIGNSTMPSAYQAEVAKHLCAAIDLDPRYVRYVKAMGEGARAALRGVVSRFLMDGHAGPDGSTLLVDSSALTEGQTMDSMVDLDGDQVLEDQAIMTEELVSEDEGDDEELEEELHQGQEEHDEREDDMESQSVEDMMDAMTDDDAEAAAENSSEQQQQLHPPAFSESDISMSF